MTLHWKDNSKPLKQICLVDVETEPDPRWITIVCGNQENLLKTFALCWRAFAPDIQVGFNDSDYDWHFIMERAYHLNIFEWMWERMTGSFKLSEEIIKWNYHGKIGAKSENTFKKKGKKKNNENTDSENTLHILENGEEDTEVKEFLGEVASIAYVSLFDTHYRANGMKVRNLLGSYAFKRDMLFNVRISKKVEKGKYSGAYVFPPKKGIETKRPVTGLDFTSLYPSLIMAYNLSPEKFIFNPEKAVIINKKEWKHFTRD
ncbi:hypothetical protein RhiirB3_457557 [Rhizophagus irregularis]|nr:hypothetical protein RhiirB3_457557 [Rhizophagus irregularis]